MDERADAATDQRIGVATLAVQIIPTGVRCLVISTVSTVSTSTSFAVTGGASNLTFSLGQLKLGQTTFNGEAYTQVCTSIAGQTPAWIADPFVTTLRPGVISNVAMTFRRNNPVMASASFVDNLKSISMGTSSATAVAADGSLLTWGNVQGLFGSATPTAVTFPTPVNDIRFGNAFACTLSSDGNVRCFGTCTEGQFPCANPVPSGGVLITLGGTAVSISTGYGFTCAILSTGTVKCWGEGSLGQLGNGVNADSVQPVTVSNLADAISVAAGDNHACAVNRLGRLSCWGHNVNGQLGVGVGDFMNRSIPTQVVGEEPVLDVVGGPSVTCARRVDGSVRCWGYNGFGTVGDGTTTRREVPTLVNIGADALQVALTGRTGCALRSDRSVVCWGYNVNGTVGDETALQRLSPTPVMGLPASGVDHIGLSSCMAESQCAFVIGGGAWCWGNNSSGQIGDGTRVSRFVATPVKL